jgi:hypothetical protein
MNAIAPYIFGFGGEPWDKLDLGKRREKLGDHLAALGFLSEPVSDETIRVWQELHIIPAVSHRTAELLISLGYPQAPPTTEIVFSDFTYHIDKAGRFTELYCNLVLRALSKDGVTKVSRRHTYFGDCDNENMLHFYPMSHCSIELKEYDGVEGWTVVFLLGDKVTPESGPYSFSYRVKVRAKRPPKRVVSMTARSQPIRGVRRVQFHPEAVPSRVWYFENLQRSSMVYPPYSEEFKLEPDSASSVERVLTTNGNTDAGIRWEFDVSLAGGLNVAVAKGVTAMGDE